MSRGLFCHDLEYNNINLDEYDFVFLLETSLNKPIEDVDNLKIKYIDLSKYFMRAHKKTRFLNQILLKNNHSNLFVSLLKASDRILFENMRHLEVLKDIEREYNFNDLDVQIENEKLFIEILNLMKIQLSFKIHFKIIRKTNFKELFLSRLLYRIIKLSKYLYYFFRKKNREENYNTILVPYDSAQSYKSISYIDSVNVLVYPLLSDNDKYMMFHQNICNIQRNRFVTYFWYFKFFINSFINYQIVKKMDIPCEIKKVMLRRVADLEFYNVLYQSVVDTYKPEIFVGQFDTTSYIDYITQELNKCHVKTLCIPHGVNYKYKVNYISYGVNKYGFWSLEHQKQFHENMLIKNQDINFIVGHFGFREMKNRYLEEKNKYLGVKKSILVIGEYFSQDLFYTSAFNYETSKRLFEKLKEYTLAFNIEITVRTRLNDAYHSLAMEYEKFGILISTPEVKDIFTDIMEHDLIVSVFSNALHESLLLRKKTLQVNFLGIENYRNLAERGLVYYVSDENELDNFLEEYMKDKLRVLDFDLHETLYCNKSQILKKEELLCI